MMALAAAIYRTCIRLYPHAFWRAFHEELEDDFADGWRDARDTGRGALVRLCLSTAADFAVSLVREWLRTPWLPVLLIAGAASFAIFAFTAERVARFPVPIPSGPPADGNGEALKLIVLLVIGTLIPIVGAIFGSLWPLLLRRRQPGRRRHV